MAKIDVAVNMNPISGQPVSGTLKVYLCGFQGVSPSVVGSGFFPEIQLRVPITGSVTVTLDRNDDIVPAGTFYCFVIETAAGTVMAEEYFFTADDGPGPLDLSTKIPGQSVGVLIGQTLGTQRTLSDILQAIAATATAVEQIMGTPPASQ